MLHRFLLPLAAFALGAIPAVAKNSSTGPVLTAEELFRAGTFGHAEISPDGRHLGAILVDPDDNRDLLIVDLTTYKPVTLMRGSGAGLEAYSFRWLDKDNLLYNVSRERLYSWGLYVAPFDRPSRFYSIDNFDVTSIVGLPQQRTGHALVWIVQDASRQGAVGQLLEFDAYHRPDNDRFAGSDRPVVQSYDPPKGGELLGWICNHDGDLALCLTWKGGRAHLHRYVRDRATWADVPLDLDNVSPMALDRDDRFLWVVVDSARHGSELRRCDLATGELEAPVYLDPDYGLSAGFLHFGPDHEMVGITYVQRRTVSVWFTPEYGAIQAAIDKFCPGTDNVLVDADRAGRKLLFRLQGPQQPGSYVLLDLDARKVVPLTGVAPWLARRPLLPMRPVTFHSRDHVKLEGYLTLPASASPQHPVPLVVLVHGGPWVRDTDAFDPEAQFLASRGYAVLQPNYRGSSGYSVAVSREHKFDFRLMHDDVTDATRAMARSPLIDPKRIAIMGGSFGGYLALAGVTFEPDLYRCAVTECGVFDWEYFIKSKRSDGRPGEYAMLVDRLGKPGRDHDRLEEISPLAHVDQIRVPVFIAHGRDDNIVDVVQSKKLAAALKKNRIPHETFFRSLEGHGFYSYKDRVDYYHRVEAFLAANLGGISLTPAH